MKLETEGARTLYAYWNRLRDGRPMPQVREFDLVEIAHILPNTMMHTPKSDGDFIFKFFGTSLVRSVGTDLTGMSLSDVLEKVDQETSSAELMRVLVEPMALVNRFATTANEGKSYETEHLYLPLANERGVGSEVVCYAKRIESTRDTRTFPVGSFTSHKAINQNWVPLSQ
jgi:hypothetical protein